jgi:hypothetical protein
MNKIAIFYHIFQINEWKTLMEDQLDRMTEFGLYSSADLIHIGVNGEQLVEFKDTGNIVKIKYNDPEFYDGENQTLLDLYNFCLENRDCKVFYLHTKGVTHPPTSEFYENIVSWRKYLERINIDNWKKCCNLLENYDCVGTEWETDMALGGQQFTSPCYAGTFWWANASYISRLDPMFLLANPWGDGSRRWQCEFWIGTGNPNYYNFYSSGKNKYYDKVLPEEYEHYMREK